MNYTAALEISHRISKFGKSPEPVMDRIWRKVDKSNGPEACWIFTGSKVHENSYGVIQAGSRTLGTYGTYKVHILVFLDNGGILTKDRPIVVHSCDNPPCCQPLHLSAASQKENLEQMVFRNRSSKGKNFRYKIPPEKRIEIARSAANTLWANRKINAQLRLLSF